MRIGTIFLTLIVIAVGFGVITALRNAATEAPAVEQREQEVSVAVSTAEITTHQPVVSMIGTVEAKDTATMTSPLDTQVIEVIAEEGDSITKGDVLVALDLRSTEYQLEAQLAGLQEIEAQLEALTRDATTERLKLRELRRLKDLARDELTRNQELRQNGLVPQAAVDQATSAVSARELELLNQQQRIDNQDLSKKRLQASQRRARAQIGQLRVTLERGQVLAPFTGIVKTVHTAAGTRVGPGAPLVELYDPTTIRLRTAIPNEYAAAPKLEGVIRNTTGNQRVRLLRITPEAKPGRGTVDALFSLPTAGTWLLGTAVEFDMLLPLVDNAIALPFDAFYKGNRVYVVNGENRAEPIECSLTGQTYLDEQSLALLDCPALQANAQVVINRVPNLVKGTKLNIVAN